jgi:phage gpG-like protein
MAQVQGLKLDRSIVSFTFKPSIGIVASRVNKLSLDIRSFRVPLTRSVKQVMIPSFQKNFTSGGRPAWEPLAEETIARKKSDRILVDTGRLQRVVGQLNIWSIGKTTATIRDLPEAVSYGLVHQAGTSGGGRSFGSFARRVLDIKPGEKMGHGDFVDAMKIQSNMERGGNLSGSRGNTATIPARPFVMMQPEDEKDIEQVFARWLDERLAGFVLRS